ncbi:hypothetical protein MMPV_002378 [Pyropia vietnamensis]
MDVPPWFLPPAVVAAAAAIAPPTGRSPQTVVEIPLGSVVAPSLTLVSPLLAAQHVAFLSRPPRPPPLPPPPLPPPLPPPTPTPGFRVWDGGPASTGSPPVRPPPPAVPSLDAQLGLEAGVRVVVEAQDLGANEALHEALAAALARFHSRRPRWVPPDPHHPPLRVALVAGGEGPAGTEGGGEPGWVRLCRYRGSLVDE